MLLEDRRRIDGELRDIIEMHKTRGTPIPMPTTMEDLMTNATVFAAAMQTIQSDTTAFVVPDGISG